VHVHKCLVACGLPAGTYSLSSTGGQWEGPILPSIKGDPTFVDGLTKVQGQASVWAVGGRTVSSSPEEEGLILLHGRVPR
jgi:hypothetical protein